MATIFMKFRAQSTFRSYNGWSPMPIGHHNLISLADAFTCHVNHVDVNDRVMGQTIITNPYRSINETPMYPNGFSHLTPPK